MNEIMPKRVLEPTTQSDYIKQLEIENKKLTKKLKKTSVSLNNCVKHLNKKTNQNTVKKDHEIRGLVTVTEKTVKNVEVHYEKVLDAVNHYLDSNDIANRKYKATSIEKSELPDVLYLLLARSDSEYDIDEDFESDGKWLLFCADITTKCGLKKFGVPYWHYPK